MVRLNPPLNPIVIKDANGLQQLDGFFKANKTFGIDVETNVVNSFFDRRIRTIQLGTRDVQYVIDLYGFDPDLINSQGHHRAATTLQPVVDALHPALDSGEYLKVGHNLLFDYIALSWCLGIQMWYLYDTMLGEQALYAGEVRFLKKGFWGLDHLAERYAKLHMEDHSTTFTLTGELSDEHIQYAALDPRAALGIYYAQWNRIVKEGLDHAVRIDCDAIPPFGDAHIHGFYLDQERWRARYAAVQAQIPQDLERLDNFFIPIVGRKNEEAATNIQELENQWRSAKKGTPERAELGAIYKAAAKKERERIKANATYQGQAAINYGATAQVLKALKQMGLPVDSTSEKKLAHVIHEPVIQALMEYRGHCKILSTYGETFIQQYVHKDTGRIHSKINIYGAETGRTTSSKPNMQNIPKGAEWRACFRASPECKIVTLDYNGQELRILTEFSQDPAWITAFNNGWDLHSYCAELLGEEEWRNAAEEGCAYLSKHDKCKCKKHKERRNHLKSTNFAIPYGMSIPSLAKTLGIPLESAQALMARYGELFPSVLSCLEKMAYNAVKTLQCRTASGRRRKFKRVTSQQLHARMNAYFQALRPEEIPTDKNDLQRLWKRLEYRAKATLLGSIKREGKNTPIQGTGADMIKKAYGCGFDPDGKPYLWHQIRSQMAWLVNCVHDEGVLEAHESIATQVFENAKDAMIRAGKEFIKCVPVLVDGTIDDCWHKD